MWEQRQLGSWVGKWLAVGHQGFFEWVWWQQSIWVYPAVCRTGEPWARLC